ncbi:MAG: TIGR02281 family clan AA aspartic protease, partial [Pseudomonadota bacterium]
LVFTLSTLFFGTLRLLVTRDYRPLRYGVLSVGVLATLTVAHSFRADIASMVNLVRGQMVPSLALSHTAGQIELRRGWDGHYRADGVVNGYPLRMMIDTGASMVLVPYEDAVAMGFKAETLSFSMPVSTANGQSSVAPVRLKTLRIGPIVIDDVPAAVAPPGRLASPLLGMSFLERLSETTFRGDRLILRASVEDMTPK